MKKIAQVTVMQNDLSQSQYISLTSKNIDNNIIRINKLNKSIKAWLVNNATITLE